MEWSRSRLIVLLICVFGVLFSNISMAEVDPEKWDGLKDEYLYNQEPFEVKNTPASSSPGLGSIFLRSAFGVIAFLVIIGALIYLIVRLVTSGTKNRAVESTESNINIEDFPTANSPIDILWEAFNKAREEKNFRECLRILYQISLKKLSDADLVKTASDKTNWDYVDEISHLKLSNAFSSLTAIHEYTWYGSTLVNDTEFTRFENRFLKFINTENVEE